MKSSGMSCIPSTGLSSSELSAAIASALSQIQIPSQVIVPLEVGYETYERTPASAFQSGDMVNPEDAQHWVTNNTQGYGQNQVFLPGWTEFIAFSKALPRPVMSKAQLELILQLYVRDATVTSDISTTYRTKLMGSGTSPHRTVSDNFVVNLAGKVNTWINLIVPLYGEIINTENYLHMSLEMDCDTWFAPETYNVPQFGITQAYLRYTKLP